MNNHRQLITTATDTTLLNESKIEDCGDIRSDLQLRGENTVDGLQTNQSLPASVTPSVLALKDRFRKFLPVVVDVETAGFNAATDALLEIACIPIMSDEQGRFYAGEAVNAHIQPFEGANLEASALAFTGIDPNNPLRKAIAEDEKSALRRIFKHLNDTRKSVDCRQCILVGHNAHFDLAFLQAAVARTHSKNQSPFHAFSVFDTVTLSALAFGQTVLARACQAAGIEFNGQDAHSALYDTQKTAELFCYILNHYPMMAVAAAEPETVEADTDIVSASASDVIQE